MSDVDVTVSQDALRRMWQGYQCLRCYQKFTESWPEVCTLPGCGYRVRDNQTRDLETEYGGEDTDLWKDEEWEPVEKRAKRSGIWVPKAI